MDAVQEADLVVVTDTGSTDNTVQKLRERGAVVYTESISPWRFDTARNLAMDHIPEDVDICVSNDLDEIFDIGWREKVEEAWQPHYTRAAYLFEWSRSANGEPGKTFPMEKIHRRHGFRWVHPVHEVLKYSGPDEDKMVWIPGLILRHYPDPGKSRGQYLPLLELSAQENPQDDRVSFWLGREYMYYGLYDKCITELTRYLALPAALWREERSAAMRFLSASFGAKGDVAAAKNWLFRAIAECIDVREPYLEAARFGYRQRDWPLVMLMVEKALSIKAPSGSYLVDPAAWGYELYDFGALACYYLGRYEKSLEYAEEACRLLPGDKRLQANLDLIKENQKKG